jgi:hypothetical protein
MGCNSFPHVVKKVNMKIEKLFSILSTGKFVAAAAA